MNKLNCGIFLLLLSSPLIAKTAVNSAPVESLEAPVREQKLNLFEMKRKLQEQARYVQDLGKEMNSIETNLGIQNKKYLKLSDSRMKLEEMLSLAKKNIDLDNLNLKKNYNETKSVLMGILLNKLEKTESPSDILARKVLVRDLQSRMVDLEALMKSNQEANASVNELYERLQASLNTEKELVAVMNDLEAKKKELREALETENLKREQTESKFNEIKNKMAIDNDAIKRQKKKESLAPVQITEEIKIPTAAENPAVVAGNGYRSPLYQHSGLEYNQKGVTFKFQGKNEVLATKAGRIAYTGSLANYGNVVMIDHGNDTRTVLLGQFDFVVKNGDKVTESQVVGYTNPKSVNGIADGKIYFEVRKNNLAQNTYLLLDKKTLSKYNSK